MISENLLEENNAQTQENTVKINLLGPIRLNEELFPALREQPCAVIMTVSKRWRFCKSSPKGKEVLVRRVYPLRFAASAPQEKSERFVQNFNDQVSSGAAR